MSASPDLHPAKAARLGKFGSQPPLHALDLDGLLLDAERALTLLDTTVDTVRESATTDPTSPSDDVTIRVSERDWGNLCFAQLVACEKMQKLVDAFDHAAGVIDHRLKPSEAMLQAATAIIVEHTDGTCNIPVDEIVRRLLKAMSAAAVQS